MREFKMLRCKVCGKIIGFFKETPVPTICCGQPMEVIKANSTDGAFEKHVPVVSINKDVVHVEIGSTIHPMLENHYIEFVILQTDKGYQRKDLKPGDQPILDFKILENEKPLRVFEYCNLHGLWVKEL